MTGLGLTVLPAVAVSAELSQGRLLKLPWMGPDLTVVTHVVWHKDKWLSPALDAFLSLTREMLATQKVVNVTDIMANDASNEPRASA